MAAGFFLWAILSWHPLLMILALFIFVAGQQELAMVRFMASRRQEQSLDLLPINPSLLQEPVVPVEAGFSGFTWDARARLWIEWRNGQPIHFISMP